MVDFDSDATVAIPAYDIVRVLILQRRDGFVESMEAYHRTKYKGVTALTYEVRSRLASLFLELRSALKDSMKKEEFENLCSYIESKKIEDVLDGWYIIDEWLYEKKLTKFDTRIKYDKTNTENENDMKGL